jgi:hypothetical protein
MPPPPQTMGGHGGPSTFDKRRHLHILANDSENGRYDGFHSPLVQLTPGTAVGVCVGAVFGISNSLLFLYQVDIRSSVMVVDKLEF